MEKAVEDRLRGIERDIQKLLSGEIPRLSDVFERMEENEKSIGRTMEGISAITHRVDRLALTVESTDKIQVERRQHMDERFNRIEKQMEDWRTALVDESKKLRQEFTEFRSGLRSIANQLILTIVGGFALAFLAWVTSGGMRIHP